ncbi:MAG: phosphate acyltransferase PlsX, partial [Alphaproteobacteria bacterium]|nr:phosphate acyltransferase PlsX [Alphaproteobacteria bacterium]
AAIRSGRESTMWKAVMSVRNGYSKAVVSAGNTGVLMAMSKICLGMIPGVYRPAIIAQMPTLVEGKSVTLLDLGANTEADSDTLVQFALMGTVYASAVSGVQKPKVGLLNIGEEDLKGRDEIKVASAYLRENAGNMPFEYSGFVEGNDISKGKVDVFVTDGFTGNVSLKTVEGTVKLVMGIMKNLIKKSLVAKVCAILALPLLYKMRKAADYRLYSGAMFIGVDGISVKAHGHSDALGIYYGAMRAVKLVDYDIIKIIKEQVESCNLIR